MIGDFVAINHVLRGRDIKIYPIADVHIGSKECDLDGFKEFISKIKHDEDAFVILCGDIINNGVKDSLTNVYEETMPPSMQVEVAVELLSPIADKIMGVVGGNHEARSRKAVDLDPMYTICVKLGIDRLYRQNMAFIRIKLAKGRVEDRYAILAMHGKTAGKKRKFAYALEGIDCLVTGHTHEGIVEKPSRLVLSAHGVVYVKSLLSVTATSWLDYGGYGAAAMYLPNTTSNPQCITCEFTGTNNKAGKMSVSW